MEYIFNNIGHLANNSAAIGNQLGSSYIEEPFLKRNFPELNQNT
jgi:hypothetical protein